MSSSIFIPKTLTKTSLLSLKQLLSVLFNKNSGELSVNRDLPNQGVKILDASAGANAALEAFLHESIPTSRFINGLKELVDPKGKYMFPFPKAENVKEVVQKVGIERNDQIVLYAQPGKIVGAARTYVILNAFGFNVSLLNGGLSKYIAEGYPTEKGVKYTGKSTEIGDLEDPSDSLSFLNDLRSFEKGENENLQVIDSRPPTAFDGKALDHPDDLRQGNVGGSVNILPGEFMNKDETFKSDEELLSVFDKYSLDPKKDTVVMCRGGVAATIGIAALQGSNPGTFGKVLLYDGSWSEYGSA
mmetsp:Transcript_1050/g.917  ORF Transcript_1050/g.917 Transcript_1050/m.917 type:complete len:301 (+) Transcript_1050:1-903(+)